MKRAVVVFVCLLWAGAVYAQPPSEGDPLDDPELGEEAPLDEVEEDPAWPPAPLPEEPTEDPAPAEPPVEVAPVEAAVEEPPTVEDTEDTEDTEDAEDEDEPRGFVFGAYGRVVAASDLDGGTGRDADIVAHGPRIDEDTYAELELRREDRFGEIDTRIVATMAVTGPLFHFDGDFEDRFAIRNLFFEGSNVLTEGLSLWAGSRMVRGDDVYLLDFWPMDNLNLVGGGVRYRYEELLEGAVAFGLARPDDPFQRQVIDVVAPSGFLPEEVLVLDRPRLVLNAKATVFPIGRGGTGLKASLYGEAHSISAGESEDEDGVTLQLPSDSGYVLGAQVGAWLEEPNAFVNLFLRYGRGLGAYDPLGVPFRIGSPIETDRAEELTIALSANFEWEMLGAQLGAYFRRFRDADPSLLDRGAVAEGAITLRPYVWLGEIFGVAAEASYQALETTALDERTGDVVGGSVVKLGLVPFFSPAGRGTYTRPHLRIIYSVSLRNDGAQALYPDRDPRSRNSTEHFLGVGAEWWFDSSSYQ